MKKSYPIILNKYLALCGLGSRRKTIDIIQSDKVFVNQKHISIPYYKVQANDKVVYRGKVLNIVEQKTYALMNKPKDIICTTKDERGRKTILDLIPKAIKNNKNIAPVGRLDRNTLGLILLTNDGDLSQRLSHPKYNIKKIYEVEVNKNIERKVFQSMMTGVELEDGKMSVDNIAFVEKNNKKVVGIEIHSGRNRVVRRLFEHFGYQVKKLDRVVYANLTKKNLPRGKFRLLSPKEVSNLYANAKS